MVGELEVLRIFVASPGDVKPEREVLESIVKELNDVWSKSAGIVLQLVKWETHVYPDFGPDPQAVISEQVGDDYDIFVGILWSRFGTPTPRAESGTEEEFQHAYSRHTTDPDSVKIMIYFKEEPVSPSKVDLEQLARVREFRERLGELGGLYWTFGTLEDFTRYARMHLSMQVRDRLARKAPGPSTEDTIAQRVSESQLPAPMEDYTETEEEGFLDLIEQGTESAEVVAEVAERLTHSVNNLAGGMGEQTDELLQLGEIRERSSLKEAKRIMNRTARTMENFANHMSAELPLFRESYSTTVDSFGKAAALLTDFDVESTEQLEQALTSVRSLKDSVSSSRQALVELRQTIAGLPRVTTRFNKAKRQSIAVLDSFDREMQAALNLTSEVEGLIEVLIAEGS